MMENLALKVKKRSKKRDVEPGVAMLHHPFETSIYTSQLSIDEAINSTRKRYDFSV